MYGVPGINFKADPKQLGDPLKKEAALKRDGQRDVKPTRVEVFQREDGLSVVYLFPLSAEITARTGRDPGALYVELQGHNEQCLFSYFEPQNASRNDAVLFRGKSSD